MVKKYYHATNFANFSGIMAEDVIKAGIDGGVYLCDTAKDACKFLAIRGEKGVYVFEVEVYETKVVESFDHNENYFGCKAYLYLGDIPFSKVTQVLVFK